MMKSTIDIFDTTLRDGTQGEKIAFSANDKLRIAQKLDESGFHYIEGGWPGSNPTDMRFFEQARETSFQQARIVAFGSTCRPQNKPGNDHNIQQLIKAGTPAISIFGKSWLLHVHDALKINADENCRIISDSIAYLKNHDKEVIYDAEHFFDGYKDDPEYALQTLKIAAQAGADIITLCDTNGGTMPAQITSIVHEVKNELSVSLGIHAHNDCELAVANTLSAVEAGCTHVQGTMNGYGERCGNANLCSVIPNLQIKQNYQCIPDEQLANLTSVSRFVSELANVPPHNQWPFVGRSAFAHKGGVHVSAVMRNELTYEHVQPESVGNQRRILISDLSGKSNITYKSKELGIAPEKYEQNLPAIVDKVKKLENEGFRFETADASFELLINRMNDTMPTFFALEGVRVISEKDTADIPRTEATMRLWVENHLEHSAAEGNGPVNALDTAMRKALGKFYPLVDEMYLQDYKVRVLNGQDGTGAMVRVLIDSSFRGDTWGTVGVSHDIIDASWQALSDSFTYFLMQYQNVEITNQPATHEVSV